MAGGRRRALAEEQLRDIAATVFATRGVNRTSLADIADAVGASRTSLYTYYASKEDLLVAIVDQSAAEARAVLAAAQKADSHTSGDRLRHLILGLVEYAASRPDRIRLLNSATELPPPADRHVRTLNRRFFKHLQQVIEQGMDDGELSRVDSGVAAHVIIGSIRTVPWWLRTDGPLDTPRMIEQITDQLVRGLLRTPSTATTAAARKTIAALREGIDRLEQTL